MTATGSEGLFGALFDGAPDATVCVDETGVIALVNTQAEHVLGYRRDELLGQSVDVLVPDEFRGAHPTFRIGYFDDPRPRSMGEGRELAVRRRDGSTFRADISLNALRTAHGLLVSAAIRDVSDRVRAEAERDRFRAEAEEARVRQRAQHSHRLETLGQLAGGVAHDFNNLLGAIEGYATFVQETVIEVEQGTTTPDWSAVRSDVEQILAATGRAGRLVHQLLAFARHEASSPELVDLNVVVDGIEELLRRTIGDQVDLVRVQAAVSPVLIDVGEFEQVLVNLAVNARDAMESGGKLTIATDQVEFDTSEAAARPGLHAGPYGRLRVIDEGAGMTPEVAGRVFEPFFTTKPKGQGTGLGLATAYAIVITAGGDLQVMSEVGEGTTFAVLLPTASAPEPPAAPEAPLVRSDPQSRASQT